MLIECAREGCDETFNKKKHNQKYHDDACCKLATNERLMKRYYEKRAQKLGKTRICTECEVTKLSRYNDSTVCAACSAEKESQVKSSVKNMILSVTWEV